MARRRYQNPPLKQHRKWWTIVIWKDDFRDGKPQRRQVRVRLAPIATTSERKANKLKDEYLRPLNASLSAIASATPFKTFVEQTYVRLELKNKASTTRQRYQGVIDNYLVPAFGSFSLGELTPVTLQTYFTGLGDTKLSHESIDKIRDVLASILKKAAYQKYHLIKENPMEYIEIPRATTGKRSRKPHITPEQFDELVNAIPEPYATMFFVAVYTGLRVSELIGLRWDDVGSDSITVNERYCRGDWSEPKSQASNTTIGVDRCVIERIHRLKLLSVEVKAGRAIRKYRVVKSAGPNDLVFQSVKDGKPMRDNNVLTRFIKPAARALGLGFVNWVAYEHHAQRGWSKPARTRKMSKVRCGILAFRPHWISTRSLFLNHSVAPWNLPAEWLLSE